MIICAGEILIDRFIDGEKHIDKPGGAPFNVACGMAKVGRKVGFFGSVGDDEEGESLLGFAAGLAPAAELQQSMARKPPAPR